MPIVDKAGRAEFDVVICTCNRVTQLLRLVKALVSQRPSPGRVIVVDGARDDGRVKEALANLDLDGSAPEVTYVPSSHANLPYQRWLGYLISTGTHLIYLDDDLVPLRDDVFLPIFKAFNMPNVVGCTARIGEYNGFLSDPQMRSLTVHLRQVPVLAQVQRVLDYMTGLPQPKPGKVGLCGERGPKPTRMYGEVGSLGGCLAFNREALRRQDFLFDLFALYERRIGKGEDFVLSRQVSRRGRLILVNEELFSHPSSTPPTAYPTQTRDFARALAYSRLFLSQVVLGHGRQPKLRYSIHYCWYGAWRGIGAATRVPRSPVRKHWDYFVGWLQGMWLALARPPSHRYWTPGVNWDGDAERDCALAEEVRGTPRIRGRQWL